MSYVAFARKYRPRAFEEVVGQESIAQALRSAVGNERTAPVYLFSGTHGVGKTSMARILAKALDCTRSAGGAPCLACDTCRSIDRGEALDVVEIDAASNRSVEDAERIRQDVRYKPQADRFKVYILDEVHQLSRVAFDALLKTFEEAPAHVRFILATTELHKVPATIRSRAQVFHFRRGGRAAVERRLRQIAESETIPISDAALSVVARRARGSMRDAQKLLDQVVSIGAGPGGEPIEPEGVARLLGTLTDERVLRVMEAIAKGDPRVLLEEVAGHVELGGRAVTFIEELQDAMRAVLYLQTCGADSPLLAEFPYEADHLRPAAEALSEEGVLYILQLLEDASQKIRTAREPRIVVETCLVRLARAAALRPMGEVLARLERLEEALGGGAGDGARLAPAPPDAGRGGDGGPPPARGGPPPARESRPAAGRGGRSGARASYDYPGRQARTEGPAPAPGPAPAADAPSPKRAVAELERAQRHDPAARAAAAEAPAPAAPLTADALTSAWQRIQGRLSESLGMVASVLEKGAPRVRLEGDAVQVEVRRISDMFWRQLDQPQHAEAIAAELGRELGRAVPRVAFARAAAPAEGEGPDGGPRPAGRSIYDEEIVKVTQRELAAQPMTGDRRG